ncbi:hypothetical protein PRECH8_14290 [Insulibacter thermoxylanivorax]|uniref:Transcription elongation factor GreA/GreB C-terminal domain-containing protein n=1 Tax=Insulibacter thermoxylanivorax TaxID=2749268 RepID=A0A916QFJ0_9BACL|nr:GreA/GreB family elongation factor [Insulibacter thermoxylanivorax]GFR38133.1 hypothetical protein PRECH8_14290 [Insulibacter thermoxylanivorax]
MSYNHLQGTRKHLVEQLTFFDEQHPIFLDTYFQEYSKERQQVDKLLRDYIAALEQILTRDDEGLEEALQSITLLGSCVTITYLDDGFQEEYTIVYPTEADPDQGRISFLSPLGKHLLLASAGDEIMINSPSSQYQVRVDRIKFSYLGEFAAV